MMKLPEPVHHEMHDGKCVGYYSEAQMREAVEAMREACVQECIKAGNSSAVGYCGEGAYEIADRIGALEIET